MAASGKALPLSDSEKARLLIGNKFDLRFVVDTIPADELGRLLTIGLGEVELKSPVDLDFSDRPFFDKAKALAVVQAIAAYPGKVRIIDLKKTAIGPKDLIAIIKDMAKLDNPPEIRWAPSPDERLTDSVLQRCKMARDTLAILRTTHHANESLSALRKAFLMQHLWIDEQFIQSPHNATLHKKLDKQEQELAELRNLIEQTPTPENIAWGRFKLRCLQGKEETEKAVKEMKKEAIHHDVAALVVLRQYYEEKKYHRRAVSVAIKILAALHFKWVEDKVALLKETTDFLKKKSQDPNVKKAYRQLAADGLALVDKFARMDFHVDVNEDIANALYEKSLDSSDHWLIGIKESCGDYRITSDLAPTDIIPREKKGALATPIAEEVRQEHKESSQPISVPSAPEYEEQKQQKENSSDELAVIYSQMLDRPEVSSNVDKILSIHNALELLKESKEQEPLSADGQTVIHKALRKCCDWIYLKCRNELETRLEQDKMKENIKLLNEWQARAMPDKQPEFKSLLGQYQEKLVSYQQDLRKIDRENQESRERAQTPEKAAGVEAISRPERKAAMKAGLFPPEVKDSHVSRDNQKVPGKAKKVTSPPSSKRKTILGSG